MTQLIPAVVSQEWSRIRVGAPGGPALQLGVEGAQRLGLAAGESGGGLYLYAAYAVLRNVLVEGNVSGDDGGGIFSAGMLPAGEM